MIKILLNVPNKVKAVYLLWVIFNLYLFISDTREYNTLLNEFFSFGLWKYIKNYGLKEFLFYSIAPVIIYIIYKLFTTKDKPNE